MNESLLKIWESLKAAVPKVAFAIVVLVVGYLFVKIFIKIMKKALRRFNLDESLIGFFVKAVKIVGYIVLAICALAILGVPTTGMVAAMSAAAVAISLALKDSLSNIASGILLLVSHPFVTGDYVEVGGVSGSVVKVDMLQTEIKTPDNRKIIIPNSQVASSEIINYSSEDERRVDVVFHISYSDDVELAKKVILSVVDKHPLIDKERDVPFARVTAYEESSVVITCRVWCKTADFWTVHFDLLEQVRVKFTEEGINIPYNKLDVHIVKEDK